MPLALYNLLLFLITPGIALYLYATPRHRVLLQRFRPLIPENPSDKTTLWIHAASLGEVNTARPIITALRTRRPDAHIVLSTSTRTGMDQAKTLLEVDTVIWFPFDHPWSVSGLLKRLQPKSLILIETELWPNVLHQCHRRNIPVAIMNGRISQKHFARNLRIRPLLRPAIRPIRLACMQSSIDAERIQQLGLPRTAIEITGNTKFDGAVLEIDESILDTLRQQCTLEPHTPVLIFGSTRPGDEAIALNCREHLKERVPGLRLIIVPRHLTRLNDVLGALQPHPVCLRSQLHESAEQPPPDNSIIVVDTMGELAQFYALADVAVVGGSFSTQVQGHNPIEPAALGVATVFGPHMKNFQVPGELLVTAGGACQVNNAEELSACLESLFADTERRHAIGEAGREAVRQNMGAIERSLQRFDQLL